MAIFNSLGSNYNFHFALRSLFTANNKNYSVRLKKFLEEKYGGEAILLYKGREALRLALKIIDKKDATVAVCGYTCYAVYEPVISEGYNIEYLDIEEGALHYSYKTLQEKLQDNPKIKVLIIQNTLGYPCDIEKIVKLCNEKNIILIEDLAHSIGATYADGNEAGMVGDFALFSFSHDKMIDGVSGGTLVVRNKNFQFSKAEGRRSQKRSDAGSISPTGIFDNFQLKKINISKQILDRFYPLLTLFIRKTYDSGIGKIVHHILKRMNLLIQPMDNLDSSILHAMPSWNAGLVYREFINLDKNISHRRKIAGIYNAGLDKKIIPSKITDIMEKSSHVRFPILVKDRAKVINYLKYHNIFVSDIWFDAPIAPKKYLSLTNYKDQSPHAEKISEEMINLPTHKNINDSQARHVSQLINSFISKQNK